MGSLSKLVFDNRTGRDIVAYIELWPDQYIIRPGEKLKVYYDPDDKGEGLQVNFHANGDLQIYLWNFETTIVTTDGKIVPPWLRRSET
jgi:hypothetical protein